MTVAEQTVNLSTTGATNSRGYNKVLILYFLAFSFLDLSKVRKVNERQEVAAASGQDESVRLFNK